MEEKGKMKGEVIGIFEGVVGVAFVVSLFGKLIDCVILYGGILAVTALIRGLHVRKEQKNTEMAIEDKKMAAEA